MKKILPILSCALLALVSLSCSVPTLNGNGTEVAFVGTQFIPEVKKCTKCKDPFLYVIGTQKNSIEDLRDQKEATVRHVRNLMRTAAAIDHLNVCISDSKLELFSMENKSKTEINSILQEDVVLRHVIIQIKIQKSMSSLYGSNNSAIFIRAQCYKCPPDIATKLLAITPPE